MARKSETNKEGAQKKHRKTDEVITLLKQAFSIGATNTEACLHAGIAESTLYEWRKDDKELSEEFDRLKSQPILKAKKTINDNLKDPNTAKWYLERKCKDEFSTRTDVISSDGSMTPKDFNSFYDDLPKPESEGKDSDG